MKTTQCSDSGFAGANGSRVGPCIKPQNTKKERRLANHDPQDVGIFYRRLSTEASRCSPLGYFGGTFDNQDDDELAHRNYHTQNMRTHDFVSAGV